MYLRFLDINKLRYRFENKSHIYISDITSHIKWTWLFYRGYQYTVWYYCSTSGEIYAHRKFLLRMKCRFLSWVYFFCYCQINSRRYSSIYFGNKKQNWIHIFLWKGKIKKTCCVYRQHIARLINNISLFDRHKIDRY